MAPYRSVNEDDIGQSAGYEDHHNHEQKAKIKRPEPGYITESRCHRRDQGGADDGSKEITRTTDVSHHKDHSRLLRAERSGTNEFVVDCVQGAGHSGEECRH